MSIIPDVRNVIYGLSCVCHPKDGVRYIGLTIQRLKDRMIGHRKAARRGLGYPVYRWMRKHEVPNIIITVLEQGIPKERLVEAEMRHIALARSTSVDLLNITDGGNVTAIAYWTPERRAEHAALFIGRKHTAESLAKMSASNTRPRLGQPQTETQRAAVAKRWNDYVRTTPIPTRYATPTSPGSPERFARQSAARTGLVLGEESGASKLTDAIVVDVRARWAGGESQSSIARSLGVTPQCIGHVVRRQTWKHVA
jgi:hypothetical protein